MSLLVPTEGELIALQRLVNKGPFNDPLLKLYTNDKTPAEEDTLSDYTELNKAGYSARTLTGANWTIATSGATGYAQFAQITFTLTGQCTAYGYMVTNAGSTGVMWAERFSDGPYSIPSGGGTIKITPRIEAE